MQIDPSLLLAAATDPGMMNRNMQSPFSDAHFSDQQFVAQAAQAFPPPPPPPIAVYFRLHPSSDVPTNTRLWVSTLNSVSVDVLRQLAASKVPGTFVSRVEGCMGPPDQEITIPIDYDDELEAYLRDIGGVKPIFSVQLVSWKNP
ncbi:clr5 domain protein [Rutstroemia sp. NJR-2017a WRK4]|nr:clr5 domain protein [Rutstroemia sp. NJR-2017a WRK4]